MWIYTVLETCNPRFRYLSSFKLTMNNSNWRIRLDRMNYMCMDWLHRMDLYNLTWIEVVFVLTWVLTSLPFKRGISYMRMDLYNHLTYELK